MLTQIINGKIFTPQGWLDEGSVLIRDNKIPVSYTHLDVYKRQMIDSAIIVTENISQYRERGYSLKRSWRCV